MGNKEIVTYGGGVNTIALIIEMIKRKMKIDYILFSDTGSEKPKTYDYISYFNEYLLEKNYPLVTQLPKYKEEGLYGECIRQKRLPSIVYGFKSCSERWKLRPFNKFCRENKLFPANVYKGIDAGEEHRISDYSDKNQTVLFPLVDWGFDRGDCVKIIIDEGLLLPPKSSCFFCPSMRKAEIHDLKENNPDLFNKAVEMEKNAASNNTKVKGLARNHSWEEITKQTVIQFESISTCSRCHY